MQWVATLRGPESQIIWVPSTVLFSVPEGSEKSTRASRPLTLRSKVGTPPTDAGQRARSGYLEASFFCGQKELYFVRIE